MRKLLLKLPTWICGIHSFIQKNLCLLLSDADYISRGSTPSHLWLIAGQILMIPGQSSCCVWNATLVSYLHNIICILLLYMHDIIGVCNLYCEWVKVSLPNTKYLVPFTDGIFLSYNILGSQFQSLMLRKSSSYPQFIRRRGGGSVINKKRYISVNRHCRELYSLTHHKPQHCLKKSIYQSPFQCVSRDRAQHLTYVCDLVHELHDWKQKPKPANWHHMYFLSVPHSWVRKSCTQGQHPWNFPCVS